MFREDGHIVTLPVVVFCERLWWLPVYKKLHLMEGL